MDERDKMKQRCHEEGHRRDQWPSTDGVFHCRWCGDPIVERSYSSHQIIYDPHRLTVTAE